jgi:hypothetical protein
MVFPMVFPFCERVQGEGLAPSIMFQAYHRAFLGGYVPFAAALSAALALSA